MPDRDHRYWRQEMKTSTSSAATLGVVGGIVLGAWIGSQLMHSREAVAPETAAITADAPDPAPVAAKTAAAKSRHVTRVARAARGAAVVAPASEAPPSRGRYGEPSAPRLVMTIPMSAPELHERMKPVLARGTKMPLAVEGFSDAAQFATLAHAAHNTQVPFMLLKHRVLNEGRSLEEAIHESRPDLDARIEALRAKGEARADILSLTSAGN
jgi:hypothetical protein